MTIPEIFTLPFKVIWYALFWTYERATWQYDLIVIAILAFVWFTPPGWLDDPVASGPGLFGIVAQFLR